MLIPPDADAVPPPVPPPHPGVAPVSQLSDVVLLLGWIVDVSRGIPKRHRAHRNTDLPGDDLA